MMDCVRIGVIFAVAAACCLCGVQSVSGEELTVGMVGADFSTISDAVAAAQPGDTILIMDGSYYEGLVRIDRPVTLRGEDGGVSYPQIFCLNWTLGADGVEMDGLVIRGDATWTRVLSVRSDNNTIRNVFVGGWTAMEIAGNGNNVTGCDIYSVKGGLDVSGSNNSITCSTISRTISNPSFWVSGSGNRIVGNEIGGSGGPEPWGIGGADNIAYLNIFGVTPVGEGSDVLVINTSTSLNSTRPLTYRYNGMVFENFLGNSWGNFNGTDENGDGIGDLPHSVGGSVDSFPLIKGTDAYEMVNATPA